MSVAVNTRSRVRDELLRIAGRDVGLPELARSISHPLSKAVPFDGTCLLTLDPATLLPNGEIVENGLPPSTMTRLTEIELAEPDVNKFTTLARATLPAASLSAATESDLDRSLRHREIRRPHGFGDELRATLTDTATGTWAALTLLREAGRPSFTAAEVRFVASLAPVLADAVRRTTLRADLSDSSPVDTGFIVVAADDTVELANQAAQRWIDEITFPGSFAPPLPAAIRGVIAQTRSNGDVAARARVRTRAGTLLVVRGSLVGSGRVALLLEAARPIELASTIADTYGLTERERTVTALVARGLTTCEISDRLHLSLYTVQDHLKAIFGKTGTSSRGHLVSRLFFNHYVPRLDSQPKPEPRLEP